LRRLLQITLLVAAAFQAAGFAAELKARLSRWSASRERFDPERPASRAQMEAEVARLFPVMLREVPRDATLTLFNSRIYVIPFQPYTCPRAVYYQQVVSDDLMAQIRRSIESKVEHADLDRIERRIAFLEQAGFRYTRERLIDALEHSQYLIDFFGEGPEDPLRGLADRFEFEPVRVWVEPVAPGAGAPPSIGLYRVRRKAP
jgi:hypothetical protein